MKNTRLLLTLSAACSAMLGVAGSFLPQEILGRFGSAPDWFPVLVLQIAGALYLAFAILDWMARGNLTGGIYGRPIALGNFMHFAVVAIVLVKVVLTGRSEVWLLAATGAYALFAAWWGLVLFTSPSASPASST